MNTSLKNLSKKSAEEATLRILRNNSNIFSTSKNKVSKKFTAGGYVKRKRLPFEAESPNRVAITRPGPYRTGDGDLLSAKRSGCDDHKKFKSLMTGKAITYPRGHK